MANTEKVRLNKYLSQAGICSRREADVLIEGGKVSVNGKIADPGMRVNDLDKITVEDKPVGHREKKVVLAYYKPVGVTCTEKDKHAQITIRDVVEYPVRVTYAGRLDRDSEGLLLLTNDGDLINGLMRAVLCRHSVLLHPRRRCERLRRIPRARLGRGVGILHRASQHTGWG